ncbi:MGH1-like glycoside hydrolase domain-containing protein [Streptomyces sp. NPDC050560]|uniref:MGH1-like glycoside hydrolase domain-containing protein n=1 Tax=Streptomyces sp. NPDC050560 TaxID=3365630 RepID=UPI00378CC657
MTTTTAPAPTAARSDLRRAAVRVLLANATGSATVPSRSLYPHQWSWDSAFVALGLARLSPRRAQRELETLLGAQWADGRVPHIVFNPAVPAGAYFPGPDFWRSSRAGAAAGAPRRTETSGIVQPPVHALAAWLVHRAAPDASDRRGFLRRVYPRLRAWHRYLARERDHGGTGLVSVIHPWEAGMDNSPCWDGPLSRVVPAPAASFRRADLTHASAADRPTDLDYGRYVSLAAAYRDQGYRDGPPAGPAAFAVEDPGFNALLAASAEALAAIARTLGEDPGEHRATAAALRTALTARLWCPERGQFLCRDVTAAALVGERSVTGLLPLLVPGLPPEAVAALTATLTGPHFGLGTTTRLAPSYDLRAPGYDGSRYWRGPAWANTNWLLERGLRQYGDTARADALAEALLDSAAATGFAEYTDPLTGEGRGTRDFAWTAAVALDLLARAKERR